MREERSNEEIGKGTTPHFIVPSLPKMDADRKSAALRFKVMLLE